MRPSSLVSLLALAACASGSASTSSTSGTTATPSAVPGRSLVASITSTGATNSRMSGTVTLTPMDGGNYSVAMEFRGAPTSKQLPWAIRPGPCGDATPNSDIGSRSAYGPINTSADGQAHINTRLRIQLPDQPMHVDIMASNSQRDVIVACGLLLNR